MKSISLNGRVAIITGASRGIGRSSALKLAREGVNLVLNSRSLESLEKVKKELINLNSNLEVLLYPADLSKPDVPENLVREAAEHFGKIDILINNAGVALARPITATSTEFWDLHMAVNARAPFLMCREAIPYLKKSDAPTIINIASVVGTKGYVNQGAYTASKHALMGFTKVLAQELFEDGIRVHVISPGGVATDMVTQTRPDLDVSELMSPEEIADIVLFLLIHRGNAVIDEVNVRRASKIPWR